MVKIQDFLRYTVAFPVQRRNVGKQLPEIFIGFFIQHPAAPAYKAFRGCAGTVVAAAEYGHPFQNMNPLSFPSRISYQIGRSRQGTEASAYKIDIVFSGRPVFIGGYCRMPFFFSAARAFPYATAAPIPAAAIVTLSNVWLFFFVLIIFPFFYLNWMACVLNFCFLHPLFFMSPEYYFQKLL